MNNNKNHRDQDLRQTIQAGYRFFDNLFLDFLGVISNPLDLLPITDPEYLTTFPFLPLWIAKSLLYLVFVDMLIT